MSGLHDTLSKPGFWLLTWGPGPLLWRLARLLGWIGLLLRVGWVPPLAGFVALFLGGYLLLGSRFNPWPILAAYTLILLLIWAWQARQQLVVEEFKNYADDDLNVSVKGLAMLLVVKLSQLHDLYRAVDEQRAIPTSALQSEAIDAAIDVENIGTVLKNAVSSQSTLSLGPLSIPVGALMSLIGRLVQGPRIIGSLHKDKDMLILIAGCTREGSSFKWRVDPLLSSEQALSPSLDKMIEELACRIFTDLALSSSVRWRATLSFSQGLRAYRECLRTPKDRRANLKEAENKFIETLTEDTKFNLAYYNLGVVHTELGNKKAAKTAFEQAIAQDPTSWAAYYARAWGCCQSEEYYRSILLCKRVIELKPSQACRAKAYQLMASVQCKPLNTMAESPDFSEAINSCEAESLDFSEAINSCEMAIHHAYLALFWAEIAQQGYDKISKLRTLLVICVTDLARIYNNLARIYNKQAADLLDQNKTAQNRDARKLLKKAENLLARIYNKQATDLLDQNKAAQNKAARKLKKAAQNKAARKLKEAENLLKSVRSLKSSDATYYALYLAELAKTYSMQGKYAEATHKLRIATRIASDYVGYWGDLAVAYANAVPPSDKNRGREKFDDDPVPGPQTAGQPSDKSRDGEEFDPEYQEFIFRTILDLSDKPEKDFGKVLERTHEAYEELAGKRPDQTGKSERIRRIKGFLDLGIEVSIEEEKDKGSISGAEEKFKKQKETLKGHEKALEEYEHNALNLAQAALVLGRLYLKSSKDGQSGDNNLDKFYGLVKELGELEEKKFAASDREKREWGHVQVLCVLALLYCEAAKVEAAKANEAKRTENLERAEGYYARIKRHEGNVLNLAQVTLTLGQLYLESSKNGQPGDNNLANFCGLVEKLGELEEKKFAAGGGKNEEWEHGQILRILALLYAEAGEVKRRVTGAQDERKENLERARDYYTRAIQVLEKKHPREVRIQGLRSKLATTLLKLERHHEALQVAQEAILFDALAYDNHEVLGDVYFERGDFEHAIEAWKEAILRRDAMTLDSYGPELHLKIGKAYVRLAQLHSEMCLREGKNQEAVNYMQQALKCCSGEHLKERLEIYYSLGYFYFALSEYEEALIYLRLARNFGFAPLTSTFYLAYAYLRNKEYDASLKEFCFLEKEMKQKEQESSEKIVEQHSVGHISLGEMRALAYWGQAFIYAERDANLCWALELAEKALEQTEPMMKASNTILQFLARYTDCKGWILHKLGKTDEAIKYLEQSVAREAQAETYLHLALAYESKLPHTSDQAEKRQYLTRIQAYCQHACELDTNKRFCQQVEQLLQRQRLQKPMVS